jgi:predicted enzyme related to lactoylglutathione lyase
MPQISESSPGSFCWAELATTDQPGARTFYQSLFGWGVQEQPMGPGETYSMFKKSAHYVAAGYRLQPEQKGVPPNWQVYVRVADADAAAAKAKELGGSVLAGPLDVFDSGRMAVVKDPQGAVLGLWQPNQHPGFGVVDEASAFCWAELMTNDLAGSAAFYKSLFGWGSKPSPEYTEWSLGERSIGGMLEIQKDWGPMPPHWLVYFMVDDCDAAVARAQALGGAVTMPARDFPGVGRIALLKDPQGAHFYVIRLTGPLGH